MPKNPIPLKWGHSYHIYNRGVNRENLFIEERNYRYFLHLYTKHITPFVETYAYCLLWNHFHFSIRVKTVNEICQTVSVVPDTVAELGQPSQKFSNLFNAYAKTINLTYRRTGSLFQRPFQRIEVTSKVYALNLITYIHKNPELHGLVDDFRTWPYSSYNALIGSAATRLSRDTILDWYGNRESMEQVHQQQIDMESIKHLVSDDF
ncbi:MAG: hypothetical protein MAG431_00462 [Chloroflexi bacterium]|nr:hypothetical protein [Chloroflexota bacterium]